MNKGLIIATVLIVVLVLGLPILSKVSEMNAANNAEPIPEEKQEPAYWNNDNFVGTEWSFMLHKLVIQPGGVATLTGPVYNESGTWSIENNEITLAVPSRGLKKTGRISGKQFLDGKGKPLPLSQTK